MRRLCALLVLLSIQGTADDNRSLSDRTRQYLFDLIRLATTNPPGNETRVADYMKQVADSYGISAELVGTDPKRLDFIARLKGAGHNRPLLLMAHSDVVPADRSQWTADPFGAEIRNGFVYGRGTLDAKSFLAASLGVMVEIKRRNVRLDRDVILLSEADEEVGSTGIEWVVQHAASKIDAEFALNWGGAQVETKDGIRVFEIQTSEKVPLRVIMTAKGTAGQGSLPRADNPVLHISRALVKISEAEQPVRLTRTTRRFLGELAKLNDYPWLGPLLPKLDNPLTAQAAANTLRQQDPELDALVRTTVTATLLRGGKTLSVIPNAAEAELDVRRVPGESRDEVLTRLRQIINDSAIELNYGTGLQMPTAAPSTIDTPLYRAIEKSVHNLYPRETVVVPVMSRGATDAAFLRAKGVPVYGAPLFLREPGESRVHGNDERIALKSLDAGVELLWQMVLETAGEARKPGF
jgi:acetylornithine deacetylase/succinyl-diaminopimelate desuccinylase-like protein